MRSAECRKADFFTQPFAATLPPSVATEIEAQLAERFEFNLLHRVVRAAVDDELGRAAGLD